MNQPRREDNVLLLPSSSLFSQEDGWALFVVENGIAIRHQATVGQRNGLSVQITDHLEEGMPVINHPNDEIDDGARVKGRK